ncbi:phage tail fiber protein [Candidatus Pelagibacter sp.]|nr:phage tail fiber protein [Candidatus Pelagibacter sp.]
MAFAINTYTGNGSLTSFSVSFPYIEQAHVIVTVGGVTKTQGSDYSFTNSSTIAFGSAPANGAIIKFTRSTNRTARLVDYQDGSTITEAILDQDGNQSFFMAQEAIDITENTIGLNASDEWDATNKKIINVADPTVAQGAATKNYVDTKLAADINTVNSHKTAAQTAQTAAETAETNAETAETNAVTAKNAAVVAQTAAETALDTFDDRFLGAKSSNPSVDNDGNALVDGALYFDTTNDIMKVYDLSNTQWRQLTLTSTNQTNVNTVAGQISPTNNIATIAGLNSQITTVAGNNANINTLAGITNLTNLANAHAAVSNVNTNLAAVQNFADVYRISSSAPTSSLNVGDLYFDTTANELKVYKSSGWSAAGSTVNGTAARFNYVISGTPTTVSGADSAGNTLAYDAGFADVYLNGVRLSSADITITSGTSVVFASALANGDIVDVVAYGTFNVAAINAANISSGTINDARLPTTMAGKTLNTAIVNANTLVARGDGSSADGKITLNCSQNSHGVSIASPAHSAGQSYNLILPTSVGTNGQVLATNGNSTNQLTWIDATETKPTVADVSQTIAPATATTINITGTGFVAIPIVQFVNPTTGVHTTANTVSLTNATTLSVNCTLANGSYFVRIENPDGNSGRSTNNIITASSAPSFSTSAGSLGSITGNFSGTVFTLAGSSDSAVTFSETTSVLTTANCTLSNAGVISTTDFGGSSTVATTYTFTIRLTDAEGQTTDREFSLTSSFGATGGGQFN